MIADLPHVQYNYKQKWTKSQEEDYLLVTRNMQKEIKISITEDYHRVITIFEK